MLTLQQIIDQADILVPNILTSADKVNQLNAINNDFFTLIKIPKVANVDCVQGQPAYTLPADVRAKNIDLVKVGLLNYRDLQSEDIRPGQNNFTFDDSTKSITLSPAPYRNGLQGIVRYHAMPTSVFTNDFAVTPDAPAEYHWTYVPALAAWIALTQDDGVKASMYEAQYKTAWNVAAQNYQRE